jgi:hypothetical protein
LWPALRSTFRLQTADSLTGGKKSKSSGLRGATKRKFSAVSDPLSVVAGAALYLPATNSRFPDGNDRKEKQKQQVRGATKRHPNLTGTLRRTVSSIPNPLGDTDEVFFREFG